MRRLSFTILTLALGLPLHADEGMWLFNQFPKTQLAGKYGFDASQQFLDHLRLSSVRLGASASFVSPKGLVFTNHHVASGCIQKLSTAEHNYMANGFYAATGAAELKCPDMEANILLRIDDVTAKVNGAIVAKPGTPEANQERRAAIAQIEKDCAASTSNKCEVVTLYSGALYNLYEYRKYTDVRLVFAPEEPIAFFGGDPDNYTYPRYDLDITFFRVYDNGRPVDSPHYLKWSREGVKDGELALVSGNPGSTNRFITLAQLEYLRDTSYPMSLGYLESVIRSMKAFGARGAENKRIARDKLFGAENSYKVRAGELQGMKDPALVERKRELETKLRSELNANSLTRAQVGNAFEEVAGAYAEWRKYAGQYLLETGPQFSDLFRVARGVLRMPEETAKPNAQRLREYTEAALASFERRLYSPAPIHDAVEAEILAVWFRYLVDRLGSGNATIKAVLDGRSPEEAAKFYVANTRLKDVAERKRLAGSLDAVKGSTDSMVKLARILDEPGRAVRKIYEDKVEAVERASSARIARARFELRGAQEYPDATGTLRLSFGKVTGYTDKEGKPVPSTVSFDGLYKHSTGVEPLKLPASWIKAKSSLNPKTPFNFVSTADIINGNSGSPTVNTKGEVIGIVFDLNLEAMPNRFIYNDATGGRCVHVASQGIVEALRKVYKANRVLDELGFPSK